MDSLSKKAGYIKGLMDAMDFENDSSKNLLTAMCDLLGELSQRCESLDEMLGELNDYVESIDDDLSELENLQDRGDDDDFYHDTRADSIHLLHAEEKPAEDEDANLAGSVCPECGSLFFITGPEDAKYICPQCGEAVLPLPLTGDNMPIARLAEEE